MKAQQDSGQSQVAYCRARGLDPKYFTLWKRKLRGPGVSADQLGLFVDGSVVIEVPASATADHAERSNTSPVTSERRRAVRVLRNLPRVIQEIDVLEVQKKLPLLR